MWLKVVKHLLSTTKFFNIVTVTWFDYIVSTTIDHQRVTKISLSCLIPLYLSIPQFFQFFSVLLYHSNRVISSCQITLKLGKDYSLFKLYAVNPHIGVNSRKYMAIYTAQKGSERGDSYYPYFSLLPIFVE